VEHLGYVSTLAEDCQAETVVLDRRGAPIAIPHVERGRRHVGDYRSAFGYHRIMGLRFLFPSIVVVIAAFALAPRPTAEPRGAAQTAAAPAETAESRFPPGPGRDALMKVCGSCHGPESAVASLKTHDEWNKTLDEMANNGAQGSDEEWNRILAYLDKNFSFIFVNKATAPQLESTLDVAPEVADAIVRRRAEAGAYKSIEELKQVPGVSAATIDARKDRFVF
jgi:competence ComEA-like helix-hairpin-helix protein